jgi:RNA polymerase sigma-70 factor (ECF subfamily)
VGTHEELIAAAMAGDRLALATFVRDTQADVWRYCAYLGRGHDNEDLVQETYARALRSLHRYRGSAPAKSWLLSIARRVCADSIRSAQRRRIVDALLVRDAHAHDTSSDFCDLVALVRQLPAERREAFVLTQVVGESYAETAQHLGVPIGTIRSRVARARQDLRHQLNQAAG